jgi:ribosomal-protein-serine acetyltransferase
LRPWVPADAQAMLDALNLDRSSYLPWLVWVGNDNQDLAQCIYHVERFRREAEQPECRHSVLGIFDRATGDVLGGTSLHDVIRARHQAEIGYWIRPDRRRTGLCAEAVAGLISWAFTPQSAGGWGLRRIEIYCAAKNESSQRVPAKLGLRREVHKVSCQWIEGRGWDDLLGWGVVNEEWDCASHRLRRGPA